MQVLAAELIRQTSRFEEALGGVRQGLDPARAQDRAALEALSRSFQEVRNIMGSAFHSCT
jgi:hypothetical protein